MKQKEITKYAQTKSEVLILKLLKNIDHKSALKIKVTFKLQYIIYNKYNIR